jgi:hypothetical protein
MNRVECKWYQERPVSFEKKKKRETEGKEFEKKEIARENNTETKENVGE